jgi:GMP synthase PP-ATPase subunit
VFAGSRVPLRASLLPVLRELYDDKVRSLGRYLGLDLAAWLRADRATT